MFSIRNYNEAKKIEGIWNLNYSRKIFEKYMTL